MTFIITEIDTGRELAQTEYGDIASYIAKALVPGRTNGVRCTGGMSDFTITMERVEVVQPKRTDLS